MRVILTQQQQHQHMLSRLQCIKQHHRDKQLHMSQNSLWLQTKSQQNTLTHLILSYSDNTTISYSICLLKKTWFSKLLGK